jgi:short-subunit dehydrogenase
MALECAAHARMVACDIHTLQQRMSVERELARHGGGVHGLCGLSGCSRFKIQSPNKSDVETKEKREMRNQKEVEEVFFR